MSVNQHLTSGVSIHPENDIIYLTGNEGQKPVWISLKPLCCRDTPLPALYGYMCSLLYVQSAICAVGHLKKNNQKTCKCNIVSTTTWCRLDWEPRICTLVLSIEYLSYLTSVKEHMEF